jgi:hypothetical protein
MISQDAHIKRVLAQGGLQNASSILWASRIVGLALSSCAAMIQNESWGANIFGADPWNQSAYPAGAALAPALEEQDVTHSLYLQYRARRNHGMQPNGVGPCQLTNPALQDGSDNRGGCWIPVHNMTEGFTYLKGLITAHGLQAAFAAYNGAGPAAELYGQRALARAQAWHQAFINAGVA